jgi:multidrug resistance efflux pump
MIAVALTLLALAAACVAGWYIWNRYEYVPWTRDAYVQADVVNVAPQVSGTAVKVAVHHDEAVRKGQLLFQIDPRRFKAMVKQDQASLQSLRYQQQLNKRNAARYKRLAPSGGTSRQQMQKYVTMVKTTAAKIAQARATLQQAQLNLGYTTVRSPVDGYVTHLLLQRGDYASEGSSAITVVNRHSFHVIAYFKETKLRHIHLGDRTVMHLMQGGPPLGGHVYGIGRGIAIKNYSSGERQLPTVSATYQWVQLAQRIPVKIDLDHVPAGTHLRIGLTATVTVKPSASSRSTN